MKKAILVMMLLTILILSHSIFATSNTFKIKEENGEWSTVEDTLIKSKYSEGSSYLLMVAEGHKLGGWFGSLDINLNTIPGNNITGYIKVYVSKLGIEIEYIESYIPGNLGLGDKISNKLIIKVGNDTKVYSDIKSWPYNSRLNTRIYFTIANINNTVKVIVEDSYGESGYKPFRVYYENNVTYDESPVNLYIEVFKNSNNKPGSIECDLLINTVEDNRVYDKITVKTINYGMNDLFYLSLDFLIIAVAFNLIAGRVKRIKGETHPQKVKKVK